MSQGRRERRNKEEEKEGKRKRKKGDKEEEKEGKRKRINR